MCFCTKCRTLVAAGLACLSGGDHVHDLELLPKPGPQLPRTVIMSSAPTIAGSSIPFRVK